MNAPAFLIGPNEVILNHRGAELCLKALMLAHRGARARHGGAPVTAEFEWLLGVLTIAAKTPDDYELNGRTVRVNTAEREELPPDGSAVAEPGTEAAASPVMGMPVGLDTRAAAEVIGVSERAVRKACMRGALRAARVSGHWLIDETDAIAYRDRREGGSHERRAAGPAASTG